MKTNKEQFERKNTSSNKHHRHRIQRDTIQNRIIFICEYKHPSLPEDKRDLFGFSQMEFSRGRMY
jgi:hypothetical protein